MPRSEVYQLRLTPAEKAKLAHLAMVEGMSIARMVRKHFGLSSETAPALTKENVLSAAVHTDKVEAEAAASRPGVETKPQWREIELLPNDASSLAVAAERELAAAAAPTPQPEPSTEDIEALARQIFYAEGQTMTVARRIAKERLS